MAKRMSIKSLFMGKEMWVCSHPKTESFRMAVPDVYRSVNSVYVDSDTVSELGNWFESDSSAASTSEISSSEDCGEMPESVVEGLVRGLCSERFFFEPDCTKSIVEESKQQKGGCLLPFIKVGGGLERENEGGLLLFKEKKKVARGPERETEIDNETSPFEENMKPANGCCEQETSDGLLAFTERRKEENGSSDDSESCNKRSEKTNDNEVMIFEKNERAEVEADSVLVIEEAPFKGSLMMVMDSEDPYMDFRVSMEEMVEAYGLDNWACLEEMLTWYLKVNGKGSHGYIVGAFVDLLLSLVSDRPRFDQDDNEDVAESLEDCVDGKR